jgi:hypothetical protein
MKHKNIFIRNITLIIALFVCGAFSAPNVVLVSPYIVRGFSKTYAASFHPETFYEISEYRKDEYDTIKHNNFIEAERFNTIGIKNKMEIGFCFWVFPHNISNLDFNVRARYRFVFNTYDKGNYNLFENVAISMFFGGFNGISLGKAIEFFPGIEYTHNYCGISVGTKKQVEEKYSLELFASPSYSLTNYFDMYSDIINGLAYSIDAPIGFRYISEKRMVKFSIKSGVGLHFNFGEKSSGGAEKIYSVKNFLPSAFAEMGFHFGTKRYNVERKNC